VNAVWFELIRSRSGGVGWRLVQSRDGGRRVVARGQAEYPSSKKARRAVVELRDALPCAGIEDTTRPYEEPETHFDYVPGVFPLTVDASPAETTGRRPARPSVGSVEVCEDEDEAPSIRRRPVRDVYIPRTSHRASLMRSMARHAGAAAGVRAAERATRWAVGKVTRRWRRGSAPSSDTGAEGGSGERTADPHETQG